MQFNLPNEYTAVSHRSSLCTFAKSKHELFLIMISFYSDYSERNDFNRYVFPSSFQEIAHLHDFSHAQAYKQTNKQTICLFDHLRGPVTFQFTWSLAKEKPLLAVYNWQKNCHYQLFVIGKRIVISTCL